MGVAGGRGGGGGGWMVRRSAGEVTKVSVPFSAELKV